jgi:glycosyltransferase involved in cell wall biosynthesis
MVSGVVDPRSLGVSTYVERLAAALGELGIDYRPVCRPAGSGPAHFHLANSTRSILPHAVRRRGPFLLTVHDILPRARVLQPAQRAIVLLLCTRRGARLIVHSRHAAELLIRSAPISAGRIEIVPHPAAPAPACERSAARAALGLDLDGPPLFVLPGVLKPAKLVAEALSAAEPLLRSGRARLVLAGRVADEPLAAAAAATGAVVLRDPGRAEYERAIAAADVVLCVRADSVGESSGPLLEAIGSGRPSLVTAVGSGPEVAGASARVVEPSVAGIRAGLEALLDDGERAERAGEARRLASELTWTAAGRSHAELLTEVGGV